MHTPKKTDGGEKVFLLTPNLRLFQLMHIIFILLNA